MDAMSYSAFWTNLASTLDKVNDDHKPVLITRQNGTPAVLISFEDFQSYEETAYLMADPENGERLNEAIRRGRDNWHETVMHPGHHSLSHWRRWICGSSAGWLDHGRASGSAIYICLIARPGTTFVCMVLLFSTTFYCNMTCAVRL